MSEKEKLEIIDSYICEVNNKLSKCDQLIRTALKELQKMEKTSATEEYTEILEYTLRRIDNSYIC